MTEQEMGPLDPDDPDGVQVPIYPDRPPDPERQAQDVQACTLTDKGYRRWQELDIRAPQGDRPEPPPISLFDTGAAAQ